MLRVTTLGIAEARMLHHRVYAILARGEGAKCVCKSEMVAVERYLALPKAAATVANLLPAFGR